MKNKKQLAALICVALLVLLYLATLVVAILDFPGSEKLFAACLTATIGLPILLWIYIYVYGKFTGKRTIASISEDIAEDIAKDNFQNDSKDVSKDDETAS